MENPAEDVKTSATVPNELSVQERTELFNEELKTLLGKYEFMLGAEARVVNGQVLADPKLVDAREVKAAEIRETLTP